MGTIFGGCGVGRVVGQDILGSEVNGIGITNICACFRTGSLCERTLPATIHKKKKQRSERDRASKWDTKNMREAT